jgi:hypothetical protein
MMRIAGMAARRGDFTKPLAPRDQTLSSHIKMTWPPETGEG